MSHHTWDYESYLRQRGYRVTPQRRAIMDAICNGDSHSTFEEILDTVSQMDHSVSPATVYRTLAFLVDEALVAKAELHHGAAIYSVVGRTPHHHLICRQCRRELVVDAAVFDALQAEILERYRFCVDTRHLMLVGLCDYCQPQSAQPTD